MRLVFAGTPDAAVPSLRALLASDHEVVGVLTRPDARAGRGRSLRPSAVREVAQEAGIPVLTPRSLRDPEVRDQLLAWAPDACPVVAYGLLVPPDLLALPRHGWVNLHFSLLPAYRGAAPVQHALRAGEDVTGAVTFLLEEGMDTGPVLGRLTETVRPRDTSGDLLARLADAGSHLLVGTLDALEAGAVVPQPQPADGVSLAPKVEVDDARVSWEQPVQAVDRLVRSCTPAPGAWSTFRGARLKLGPVHPVEGGPQDPAELAPGEVLVARDEVLVGTGSGPVRLGQVQAQGKRAMDATDWARGVHPEPGEVLGG
ncbi:Methionyl-tRNA formyltransferase [Serinicoccus hydrothermalis]|uniref:Methionyl-tRNA formyltransferase n=1 Tax=Serinicoccus hydrothermalis TaxID=1758689 RepID=A0A1B1N847_9MICO|nr:methionyl-tRNA formyltransferase [Serinicoccus hydrothermalis]ANS77603.1 Methionyl-tRNA formyltransferase [Serinicoccus hydrothermalis]